MRVAQPARRLAQRGALIVALMAGIAIAMILSTVAVQSWADLARRDNEAEMMFRAQDIVRALKRYQADKGTLPTELKQLMEPGQKRQYFLRRLWKDPLVKGGQWQLLYASPSGGLFDPTVPAAPQGGAAPQPGLAQTGLNPSGPGAGHAGDGASDPTGLPIAGVKSRCTERPFRRYKDKTEYNEWVFSIFDQGPGAPALQQPNQPNPQNPTGAPAVSTPSFPPPSDK
jgi:type II secretory pathway pseudopilin PulG